MILLEKIDIIGGIVCIISVIVFIILFIVCRKSKYYKLIEKREKQLEPYLVREELIDRINTLRDKINKLRPQIRKIKRKFIWRKQICKSKSYRECKEKFEDLLEGTRKNRKVIEESFTYGEHPREEFRVYRDRLSKKIDKLFRVDMGIFFAYFIAIAVMTSFFNTDSISSLLITSLIIASVVSCVYLICVKVSYGVDIYSVVIAVAIDIGLTAVISIFRMVVILVLHLDYAWRLINSNNSFVVWLEICILVYMVGRIYYKISEIRNANEKIPALEKSIANADGELLEKIKDDNEGKLEALIVSIEESLEDIEKPLTDYSKGAIGKNIDRFQDVIAKIYWDYRLMERLMSQNIVFETQEDVNIDAVKRMLDTIDGYVKR